MPKSTEPLFSRGTKVQICQTHVAKSQTKLFEGTKGTITQVDESKGETGVFRYSIKFEDGTKEVGIEEEMIDFV